MMKKIAIISLCLLLLGVSIAAAAPGLTQQTIQKIPLTQPVHSMELSALEEVKMQQ